ncbi:MAG: nucleotidyltransferase domain-containing protein, partial [Gemmatimonadaceae bacterium]
TAVEAWASALAERPEVERIVWYGSFVSGIPTPRSDVDLAVVVSDESVASLPRHARGADYRPATAVPVPVDLTVLTVAEHATLDSWAPGWADAIGRGRVLFTRIVDHPEAVSFPTF